MSVTNHKQQANRNFKHKQGIANTRSACIENIYFLC